MITKYDEKGRVYLAVLEQSEVEDIVLNRKLLPFRFVMGRTDSCRIIIHNTEGFRYVSRHGMYRGYLTDKECFELFDMLL